VPCSFTKPLVSRENIFYEAVEREAPPLLGFIPRYLGVMLVTYRRVKSNEHSPTSSDDRRPRPMLHRAHTLTSLEPTSTPNRLISAEPSTARRIVTEPEPSFAEDDGGDTETEMPEVALDRNTHIVPRWLLNHNQTDKRRLRAASMSHSNLPSDVRTCLSQGATARRKFGDATLSTPDLGVETRFCPQPSPLSMHASLQSVTPTPDNSPRILGRFLNTVGEHDHRTTSAPPMTPNGLNPIDLKPACGFGGTGSTMVNTKLKDHIFSTILKGMTKRYRHSAGRKWRVDEEGDAADTEGESCTSPKKRSTITANDLPAIEDTAEKTEMVAGLGSDDPSSPGYGGVFHMELDSAEEDVHLKQALDSSFLPLARKRSRSRSLGPGAGVSILPSLPSLAIPRGRCDSKTPMPPSRELSTHPTSVNVEPSPTSTASSSPRQNHFILMEDLTGKLKKPCVLDLKMGTRQYGMDATPGKKKSQRKKCDRTTSRSLGVRVCGMQVSLTGLLYIPRDW
jgi:inositol-hexakisphosphate 5-kinase